MERNNKIETQQFVWDYLIDYDRLKWQYTLRNLEILN